MAVVSKVMDVIQARRSVRKYKPDPVEEEKLKLVLEAGRIAPSASNEQRWKFVVIRDKAKIQKMVDACNGQLFVGEAPVVLAVCTDGGDRMMGCGQQARIVDCCIALSFMVLEAADLGLGTCWLGHFNAEKVKAVIGVPEGRQVVAVTPLGYPAESPNARPKKALSEVVCYDAWR